MLSLGRWWGVSGIHLQPYDDYNQDINLINFVFIISNKVIRILTADLPYPNVKNGQLA